MKISPSRTFRDGASRKQPGNVETPEEGEGGLSKTFGSTDDSPSKRRLRLSPPATAEAFAAAFASGALLEPLARLLAALPVLSLVLKALCFTPTELTSLRAARAAVRVYGLYEALRVAEPYGPQAVCETP